MLESEVPGARPATAGVVGGAYVHERPAVSWAAVIAGAVAMAAFSLILLTLGTGLGLSSLSPWPNRGAHTGAFGVAAVIWILVCQIMASGLGGYLAGRLRHAWPSVGTDEAHFRDTAHGFLAWSLATLVTAAVLGAAVSGALTAGAGAAAQAGAGHGMPDRGRAMAAYGTWPMGYLIDGMLRPGIGAPQAGAMAAGAATPGAAPAGGAAGAPQTAPAVVGSAGAAQGITPITGASGAGGTSGSSSASPAAAAPMVSAPPAPPQPGGPGGPLGEQKLEIARIFLNALPSNGDLSPADAQYLTGIVIQRTGISSADAAARVTMTWQQLRDKYNAMQAAARDAADKARKATIHATLWLFVSLLVGAFTASLFATIGGRHRELL